MLARYRRRRAGRGIRRGSVLRARRRRGTRAVSQYNRAYNEAYQQGFAAGYAQGLARGL